MEKFDIFIPGKINLVCIDNNFVKIIIGIHG